MGVYFPPFLKERGKIHPPPQRIGRFGMTKSEISTLVTAIVAALEEQKVEPKAEVAKVTPKVSREAKKAQNKVLWRQINGKVKKAENAKTKVLANGFLKEAMSMTPANWTSVQNKIVAKQEALGITV